MRSGMDRKTYPTRTVEVVAVTSPPITGFRFGGRRIEEGEKVRLPLGDAKHFERVGKCKIVPDSEKVELL